MATDTVNVHDANAAISETDRAAVTLMPLPAQLSLEAGRLMIDGDFCVALMGQVEPRLERAARRLVARLAAQTGIPLPAGVSDDPATATLALHCAAAADEVQGADEEESYTLVVTPEGARISAPKPYGVLHGIETFLQLVQVGDAGFAVPAVRIEDRPRFPWRGLMLDVCRHWMPVEVIKRNLDGMAAVKLNVLHWHLTEDQGFRVESKRFPRLHELGSDGEYYTQEQIREVVAYARDRGIRVLPEFDLPGHATAWLVGHPELGSAPGPYEIARSFGIKDAALDPTREEVYAFLDQFFDEMAALFPDPYLHIGGDEVSGAHWDGNPSIQAFIERNGLQDKHGLQAYFNRRLQAILADKGKSVVGWDEVLHPDLPRDVVVQSWRGQASLFKAAAQGYQGILSHGYYLDYHQPAAFHYGFDPLPAPEEDLDFSGQWRTWHIEVTLPMGLMKGHLIIADQVQELQGAILLEDLNLSARLHDVRLDESELSFGFASGFGDISAALKLEGERMTGALAFAGFQTPVQGMRSAGVDMPGTDPPAIQQGVTLTAEQEARILGGEACMWAELVNPETLDGRLWPRLAAIAERLWSPAELTQDVEDMYRRLKVTSAWLAWTGIRHQANTPLMLGRLIAGNTASLEVLAEVVEPLKSYSRHGSRPYSQFTPLNRLVDAVPSESDKARAFAQLVERLVEDPENEADRDVAVAWLMAWRDNHAALEPALRASFLLQAIEPLSLYLSEVAALGLEALKALALGEGAQFTPEQQRGHLALLERAAQPQDELSLQVVPAVRRLVEAAHG